MTDPLAHTALVKAATLEQEARERERVRTDESRTQPIVMSVARQRPIASPVRRLRLPSLPMPRRLSPSTPR